MKNTCSSSPIHSGIPRRNGDAEIHGEETEDDSLRGGRTTVKWRHKRLDLPTFDGTNPDGWILRAEHFFAFYRLEAAEKLEAAVVAFDGDALL